MDYQVVGCGCIECIGNDPHLGEGLQKGPFARSGQGLLQLLLGELDFLRGERLSLRGRR